jgi:hypothetical protein
MSHIGKGGEMMTQNITYVQGGLESITDYLNGPLAQCVDQVRLG